MSNCKEIYNKQGVFGSWSWVQEGALKRKYGSCCKSQSWWNATKTQSPEKSCVHPDAAGAFLLFLEHSKKKMNQCDLSVEDEVGQKEEKEEKSINEEDDKDDANQEGDITFEAEEEDNNLSEVSIFVTMRGIFCDFCCADCMLFTFVLGLGE